MPLEKMRTLLSRATRQGYGIAAINVFNYESIAWAIRAAEAENMPIIIQFYPGFSSFISMPLVAQTARFLGESASVPVAVHLDHSNTYDIAVSGLGAGFPSIMVDGSALSFSENSTLTADVVRCAHVLGVDVEAELGHVGSGLEEADMQEDHFTDPTQAEAFIRITGADALAIAVGNGHGDYIRTPVLNFDRIKALRSCLRVPLVMHGGSGIPTAQMQQAVRCGMSKFNIATEYQQAFQTAMQNFLAQAAPHQYYFHGLMAIEESCIQFVREKIRMLNPDNKSR